MVQLFCALPCNQHIFTSPGRPGWPAGRFLPAGRGRGRVAVAVAGWPWPGGRVAVAGPWPGWPATKKGYCGAHRDATLQELDDLLGEYDLKRDLVEINHKAPQWSHNAVWNKKYMEPRPGFTLKQLWADSEHAIAQKTQRPSQLCQLPHCLTALS